MPLPEPQVEVRGPAEAAPAPREQEPGSTDVGTDPGTGPSRSPEGEPSDPRRPRRRRRRRRRGAARKGENSQETPPSEQAVEGTHPISEAEAATEKTLEPLVGEPVAPPEEAPTPERKRRRRRRRRSTPAKKGASSTDTPPKPDREAEFGAVGEVPQEEDGAAVSTDSPVSTPYSAPIEEHPVAPRRRRKTTRSKTTHRRRLASPKRWSYGPTHWGLGAIHTAEEMIHPPPKRRRRKS